MKEKLVRTSALRVTVIVVFSLFYLQNISDCVFAAESIFWQTDKTSPILMCPLINEGHEFDPLHSLQHNSRISCASFSPTGNYLVTGTEGNWVRVWDVLSGEMLMGSEVGSSVGFVSISSSGRQFAAGMMNGEIAIFDLVSGTKIQSMTADGGLTTGRYSPDGSYLLTGDRSGSMIFWNPETGERVFVSKLNVNMKKGAVFHPKSGFSGDGRYAAAAAYGKKLALYAADEPKVLRKLPTKSRVWSFVFTEDGDEILTALENGKIVLWDCASGRKLKVFSHHDDSAMSVDLSSGQEFAVSSGKRNGNNAVIWNLVESSPIIEIKHNDLIRYTVFSPDGHHVLTHSADIPGKGPGVGIWDTTTGDILHFLPYEFFVQSLSPDRPSPFSPDGRFLLTESIRDKTANLWAYFPSSMELVQREAEYRMEILLNESRRPSKALQVEKEELLTQKPVTPDVLVKGKYESTIAFQERVRETTNQYESEVAVYNERVLALGNAIENHYASAQASLDAGQRFQCIRESFLAVFGNPVLSNLRYDADAATFFIDLTSSRVAGGGYQQTLLVDVPNYLAPTFDQNASQAKISVEFLLDDTGFVSWKSAIIQNIGYEFSANPVGEVSIQPVAMTAPIAQADLNEVGLSLPEVVSVEGVQLSLADDPEIALLQKQLYEMKQNQSLEAAKVKERARLEEGIATLKKAQDELRAGKFEDDLPTRLAAAPTQQPDPHKFLFAVGIGNYDEVPDVPFADRSALMFKQAAVRLLGVPLGNVELLTGAEATGTRIVGRLKRLLGRLAKDDVLYFYYAGHGVPSTDGNSSYLLPVDGGAGSFQDPALELTAVYQRLEKAKVGHVVCFIDACFSGRADAESMVFNGVAPIMISKETNVRDTGNLTVFSAGRKDQFGNQYLERGHRLFTYYLIDGLLETGFIVNELESYLVEKVSRESRRLGPEYFQEPQLFGNRNFRLVE